MKRLLFLLLLGILPGHALANTIYFPQVAYGGGYSTTFVIMNTGTTNVSSRLNFYSQSGANRSDLGADLTIAAGSTARYTLPNTGPLTVVWGEFAAATGTVQGVATFDLREPGGALTTTAGVLGIEPRSSFLIPVDVAANGATGLAIGNISGNPVEVGLRLIAENGAESAVSTDLRFRPLPAHGQVADFVTNIFPQLAGGSFKGTLVIEASSATAVLAATALTVKEGLLSALPVLARGAAGATTLDFAQVAFGGGYSTTFTIMNTGSTAVTSQLRFYSQGGALRNDLGTVINIPVNGSSRYTLPNTGPLTVVWGEVVTTSGAVQGVATFDLRDGGRLTTTAGVLGIVPGNGFILPVDVTPVAATGVAIGNAKDVGITLRLRLFAENGTELTGTVPSRFTSLPARGQFADFVTNIFPQLAGTTFKGSLAIEAGAGAPASSLAATALTVKESLLSALPVIPGTIAGGGGGGNGGGGGGGGAAGDCFNPTYYSAAGTLHAEFNVTGAFTGSSVTDSVSTPNVTFEGQSLVETRSTQTFAVTGLPVVTQTGRSFSKVEGTDILQYGGLADITTPLQGSTKTVYSPPYRDKRFSLAVGESSTQTFTVTTTTTYTGLPSLPVVSTPQTRTVKYLGHETVTVPAGTFDTCKFEEDNGAALVWQISGTYAGFPAKSTSTSDGQTMTLELKSGTINGSAVR